MNDAAISVLFNIAEGFLRRKDGETSQFLRYAFASNGELKSGYYAATGRRYISEADAVPLIGLNESIARMIRRWQATLKPADRTDHESRGSDSNRQSRGKRGPIGNANPNEKPRTDPGPRTDQGPSTKAQGPI